MITPANGYRIFLATTPVDFRKGMDGLAAHVTNSTELDPYCGAFYVFRAKTGNKMKVLLWDGIGMVLIHKRLYDKKFIWPTISEGILTLSKTQFEALFEGIDWRRVVPPKIARPKVS